MVRLEVLIDRDTKEVNRSALTRLREEIHRRKYEVVGVGVYETHKGIHIYITLEGDVDDNIAEAIRLAELGGSDPRAIEEARKRYLVSGGRRGLYLFALKRVPGEEYISTEVYDEELTNEISEFLRGERI